MDVDRRWTRVGRGLVGSQRLARVDPSGVRSESGEDVELSPRQCDLVNTEAHRTSQSVYGKVTEAHARVGFCHAHSRCRFPGTSIRPAGPIGNTQHLNGVRTGAHGHAGRTCRGAGTTLA